MRNVFCKSLVAQARRPDFVFLTGDLGYKALEPLRDAMGERFLNAGIAEQNMVSVGAGLARTGLRPGSTASPRLFTPGRSSRSATTSASTAFRWCWWATAAATPTV